MTVHNSGSSDTIVRFKQIDFLSLIKKIRKYPYLLIEKFHSTFVVLNNILNNIPFYGSQLRWPILVKGYPPIKQLARLTVRT